MLMIIISIAIVRIAIKITTITGIAIIIGSIVTRVCVLCVCAWLVYLDTGQDGDVEDNGDRHTPHTHTHHTHTHRLVMMM